MPGTRVCPKSDEGEVTEEITEKPFHRLSELLVKKGISANVARGVIASIETKTKLQSFFEIAENLMNFQRRVSEGGPRQFGNDIAELEKPETNELLAGIKDLLISKQTPSDSTSHSDASAESDTVNQMRVVIEQMLVADGIRTDSAKQAVDHLELDVLNETLAEVKLVFTDLKEILIYNERDLMIKLDIMRRHKNEKLDEPREPKDLYTLFADLDNETFFKQLILDNWMPDHHENVLIKLLEIDKTKYVKLMMEHIGNNCVKETLKPLEDDVKENKELFAFLLKKISDPASKTGTKDERPRIKGKMLFIWCIEKQMRETAMVFWKKGQDCLAMALVGYRESRRQKKIRRYDTAKNGYDDMKQQMQYFSKLSIDLLQLFYANNHQNTHDLLVGKVEDLDGLTPLEIATEANFKAFIAETPVQKLLDKIWIKNIENHSKYKYAPLLLSGACPLLAPVMFEFRRPPEDSSLMSSSNEKQGVMTAEKHLFVGSYFWKVKSFMNTPLVKFTYRFLSYIGYLILFSIVLLTDFRSKMSPLEIALHVWTFILITEEIKQAIVEKSGYKNNEWNYFDIGALTIYVVGFILRMIYHGDPSICSDCLYVARIVLAFSLMVFFFRTLQFLSIYEILGPKIYTISRLLGDLINFMLILTVFVSAYGVVSNVILYPNQPLNGKLLQDVFYDAWWSLVLQFNLEDALGLNCNATLSVGYCSNTTRNDIDYELCKKSRCPANTWIVSVLLAFYALLTVIMMLNILIAMFTNSFSTINEAQRKASKMQRYRFIREYCYHSMVPTPLCVITYPYFIFKCLFNLCAHWLKDEEDSQTDNGKTESTENNKDTKDTEGNQRASVIPHNTTIQQEPPQYNQRASVPLLAYSPPKAFAKNLDSIVKDWEQDMIEEYYKNNKCKEERPVPRMKSETSANFDKTPLGIYLKQKIGY